MSTDVVAITAPAPWPPAWSRWVAACTVAEVLGMAAASAAAVGGTVLVGEATGAPAALTVLGLALLGGAVEGLAVGELQLRVLRTWLPALSRARYVGWTVAVAVAFWALGMLPSTIMTLTGTVPDPGDTGDPPVAVILAIAAVGGALGGALFGLVQGAALRGHVPHPWHWVRPNVVGWALAVAVITLGASRVPSGITGAAVVGYGLLVGLVAGACIGVVTGQALPSLELGLPWWNRTVVDLLLSPLHPFLSRSVAVLRLRGRRTGRSVTLPVQYAEADPRTLVVYVADAASKSWWRSFDGAEHPVAVRLCGQSLQGSGAVVPVEDPTYADLAAAYTARQPRVTLPADATLVRVRLAS